jgi:hypothetical protein
MDLAGPRRADRLPSDLRPLLPAEGLINYPEAQAMVRRLMKLATDPGLRSGAGARGRDPVIAVMALYPAQVALIKEMIRRAGLAGKSDLAVEVGLPDAFRHRECLAALVSLTRSHSHRAVSLGQLPELLPLALTRPMQRLIICGDPGTLVRRSQWHGALDHLDDSAASREGRLVAGLLRYLQGLGRHGGVFRLVEGNGQ